MSKIDITYHNLLDKILTEGFDYEDPNRKGVMRRQINSFDIKHNFEEGGFPLLTTKKVHFPSAVGEFLSFIKGGTTLGDVEDHGVRFWRKDALRWLFSENNKNLSPDIKNYYKKELKLKGEDGFIDEYKYEIDLGRIYPYQMRNWNGEVDQLKNLIKTLKENPLSTKKIITMWNPSDWDNVSLTPCHVMVEALVEILENGEYGLTIKWKQSSTDTFLGEPMNIAYYSLMCYFLAAATGLKPIGIEGNLSNVHIYGNHMEQVHKQLRRDPDRYEAPKFRLSDFSKELLYRMGDDVGAINNIKKEDFILKDYKSFPKIKAEMLTYDKHKTFK